MNLIDEIKRDEGFKGSPYICPAGFPTIGYGTKLPLDEYEAELLLKHRLNKKIELLHVKLPQILRYPKRVRDVLINMSYQMGVSGVLKFKKMIRALDANDFKKASEEMLDSKWAREDGPGRAKRLSKKICVMTD